MLLESYPLDLSVMANPFPFFESSVNLSVLANFANSGLKTRLSKLCKIHAAMHKLLVAQARSSAIIGVVLGRANKIYNERASRRSWV
jgi:hypothetical protein|tara:strand:- start:2979 stop:3239 length:261 start_codon:yes stop_codon:yes gene_type:complete